MQNNGRDICGTANHRPVLEWRRRVRLAYQRRQQRPEGSPRRSTWPLRRRTVTAGSVHPSGAEFNQTIAPLTDRQRRFHGLNFDQGRDPVVFSRRDRTMPPMLPEESPCTGRQSLMSQFASHGTIVTGMEGTVRTPRTINPAPLGFAERVDFQGRNGGTAVSRLRGVGR